MSINPKILIPGSILSCDTDTAAATSTTPATGTTDVTTHSVDWEERSGYQSGCENVRRYYASCSRAGATRPLPAIRIRISREMRNCGPGNRPSWIRKKSADQASGHYSAPDANAFTQPLALAAPERPCPALYPPPAAAGGIPAGG